MPNTPVKVDVPTLVIDRISRFSSVLITDLENEQTLVKDLQMKHPQFVQLAESLRAIVKLFNKTATVVVGDVEDDEATVESTVGLVEKRIES
jgi:hypothetical protein